ncbi:MAG: ADP-ribose pyrophosphatase [Chthonomonadaceae bacterium]|nr:ADP-ribose pyrophosphatase [Chthonomonadaceae bacterium]
MELTETVIGTEPIYSGRVVNLRIDTIRQPDGHVSKREIVAHPGAVCIVPIREDGMVLLVRQFRLAAGQALLEVPAGTREKGEDPEACAYRELEEETGYRAIALRPLYTAYLAPGYSTELMYAYLATGLTLGQTNPDEGEKIELVEIPIAEIEDRVLAGEFADAKTIAALLMASRLYNSND